MVKRQQHRFIPQDSDSRCCLDSERTGESLLSLSQVELTILNLFALVAQWQSASLVMRMSRVQIMSGALGTLSSLTTNMWRLWCKALGDKASPCNKESDRVALVRTFIFVTYLTTNLFICAGVIRHWNNDRGCNSVAECLPSKQKVACSNHVSRFARIL